MISQPSCQRCEIHALERAVHVQRCVKLQPRFASSKLHMITGSSFSAGMMLAAAGADGAVLAALDLRSYDANLAELQLETQAGARCIPQLVVEPRGWPGLPSRVEAGARSWRIKGILPNVPYRFRAFHGGQLLGEAVLQFCCEDERGTVS